MLSGEKILITGLTGQVAGPVARALARDNEVWGIARFGDPNARAALEKAGVRCEKADLAEGDLGHLPRDFSVALHFAVAKSGNFDADLAANAEGTSFSPKTPGSATTTAPSDSCRPTASARSRQREWRASARATSSFRP